MVRWLLRLADALRTGESTPSENVILHHGVAFECSRHSGCLLLLVLDFLNLGAGQRQAAHTPALIPFEGFLGFRNQLARTLSAVALSSSSNKPVSSSRVGGIAPE